MRYFANAKCEIKFAFSYCEAIFHTRSVFHSEAISLDVGALSEVRKYPWGANFIEKSTSYEVLFSGGATRI